MSVQNEGVPLYRPYIPGTAVHCEESGTSLGTEAGTLSLKSLSTLYLMKQKAVRSVVRPPVQQQKKCTTDEGGSGTLFEGKNAMVQAVEATLKIDYKITCNSPSTGEPTPAQLDHAQCIQNANSKQDKPHGDNAFTMAGLPAWIRPAVSGEALDDTKERRCASTRCGAVFMRQAWESDTAWNNRRYCSGQCCAGKPFIPAVVTAEAAA